IVGGGRLIAGSSSNAISGPFGADGTNLLLGAQGSSTVSNYYSNAAVLTGGPFTVGNVIVASGASGNQYVGDRYTLTLGGNTDNTSTFSGPIYLQNDMTVSQVATTGNHALNLTGGIQGTGSSVGTLPSGQSGSAPPPNNSASSPNNTGVNTLTFAGPGAINSS